MYKQFYFKQFTLTWVRSLNIKSVLFQTIQFSISTQFNSICPIDRTLQGATILSQSEPGSEGNEGVLRIPQSSCISGISISDGLLSYSGHWLWGGGLTPLQSVYSTSPADRAIIHGWDRYLQRVLLLRSTSTRLVQVNPLQRLPIDSPIFFWNHIRFQHIDFSLPLNPQSYGLPGGPTPKTAWRLGPLLRGYKLPSLYIFQMPTHLMITLPSGISLTQFILPYTSRSLLVKQLVQITRLQVASSGVMVSKLN